MKFLSKIQQAQISKILLVALVIVGVAFLLQHFTMYEGFAKPPEMYLTGTEKEVTVTLNDLKQMSGGMSNLSAIEFYDYYEKKDAKGNIVKKGFILQDDPMVGQQNETGGPVVTFGNNKAVYANNSSKTPKFPIALTDPRMQKGIKIRNFSANLGGDVEPPFSVRDTKGKLVAKVPFNLKDRSKEEPGLNKAMKIKFVFSN